MLATTQYGGEFVAAVNRGNVSAVQFHPEKSGATGLDILQVGGVPGEAGTVLCLKAVVNAKWSATCMLGSASEPVTTYKHKHEGAARLGVGGQGSSNVLPSPACTVVPSPMASWSPAQHRRPALSRVEYKTARFH